MRAVLLYDADCGFCRRSVDTVLRWDRRDRVRAIPIQSAEADDLLGDLHPVDRMASAHLVTPDGRVHSGGELIGHLFRLLPGGTPISLVASSLPGTVDRAYRWVARHRFRIGELFGLDACRVRADATGQATR